MFTLCCTSSGIFNIEDGFPWMICLTKDRRERKKRIINYFCELLHGRDNKPAWSPWIWHICSENNTIISKGERSGENMRTPGLKCQWSIPVLIFIPVNNNKHGGKHTTQTFINAQDPLQKRVKWNLTSWWRFVQITTDQTCKIRTVFLNRLFVLQ